MSLSRSVVIVAPPDKKKRKEAMLYWAGQLLLEVSKPEFSEQAEHAPQNEEGRYEYKFRLDFSSVNLPFVLHFKNPIRFPSETFYLAFGAPTNVEWKLSTSHTVNPCWQIDTSHFNRMASMHQRSYTLQTQLNGIIEDQRHREGRILYKWCRRLFGFDVSVFLLKYFKHLDAVSSSNLDESNARLFNVVHEESDEICPITVPRPRILKAFMRWYAKELRRAVLTDASQSSENDLETLTTEMLWSRLHSMCFGEGRLRTNKDSNKVTVVKYNDSLSLLDQAWKDKLSRLHDEPLRSLGIERRLIDDSQLNDSHVFKSAATLLTALPLHYSPKKMLSCLTTAVDMGIQEISSRGGDTNLTGEDMVPLLAAIVSRSRLRCPHLCIAYMKAYGIDMDNIAGREEYSLTTFTAAISWLHSSRETTEDNDEDDETNAFVPHVAERVSQNKRYRSFTDDSSVSSGQRDDESPPDWLTANACVPLELYVSDDEKVERERSVEDEALQQLKEWLQEQRLLEDTLKIFQ
eukprot:gb/GECG01015626.1/.p1 GENE.gb/GECG01015626.1/~~gb/GECG01015626.1/.p1  ORF type:complete len:519 (+),score=61.18 gb/GECG01015626.1/:1-1557(+)